MVVVKLKGGLGNQMFQYATARGISQKHVFVDTTYLDWNTTSIDDFVARNYELEIFKNKKAIRISKLLYKILHTKKYAFIRNVFFPKFQQVQEKGHSFMESLAEYKNPYLEGCFQNEKYFVSIRDKILNEFTFPALDNSNNQNLSIIKSHDNAVSIHVRRGDYLMQSNINYFGILPISYYKKAIEIVESKTSNPHYFIFSEDTEWCENNFDFLKDKCTLMNNNHLYDSWKDMYLMTECRHHIISNSSFSWWGAWLSTNEGIKLAPEKWFNPQEVRYDIRHFVPEKWTLINVTDNPVLL
jgi:hypothetical protein